MRQQLRLRVLLPVAVLGLLGAGFGAFAMGGPATPESIPVSTSGALDTGAADTAAADTGAVETGTTPTEPAPAPAPAPPPSPKPEASPLEKELDANGIVVVVFHTPGSDLDGTAVHEARAGAAAADAGFLAVDVEKEGAVAKLAAKYEVLGAPTVVVLGKSGAVRSRFDGYVDRETVAQAVENART